MAGRVGHKRICSREHPSGDINFHVINEEPRSLVSYMGETHEADVVLAVDDGDKLAGSSRACAALSIVDQQVMGAVKEQRGAGPRAGPIA
jgi:hypothetical protein